MSGSLYSRRPQPVDTDKLEQERQHQQLLDFIREHDIPITSSPHDNSVAFRKPTLSEEQLQAQANWAGILKQNEQAISGNNWPNNYLQPTAASQEHQQNIFVDADNFLKRILQQQTEVPYSGQNNPLQSSFVPVPPQKPVIPAFPQNDNLVDYSKYGDDMPRELINAMLNDADFQRAMVKTRKNEGGYVNDPQDPGGETNFGISAKAFPNEDIKNMTRERADAIFYKEYWSKNGINKLPQELQDSVFDKAVNQGLVTSIQHLHRALGIKPGNIIGNQTLDKLQQYSDLSDVLAKYQDEVAKRYDEIKKQNPNLEKFSPGWSKR